MNQPFKTLKFFILGVLQYSNRSIAYILAKGGWLLLLNLIIGAAGILILTIEGPHEKVSLPFKFMLASYIHPFEQNVCICMNLLFTHFNNACVFYASASIISSRINHDSLFMLTFWSVFLVFYLYIWWFDIALLYGSLLDVYSIFYQHLSRFVVFKPIYFAWALSIILSKCVKFSKQISALLMTPVYHGFL